jgi:hypothetical protein
MKNGNGLSMTSEYGIKRIRPINVSRGIKEILSFSHRLDYSFLGTKKAAITHECPKCQATNTNYL